MNIFIYSKKFQMKLTIKLYLSIYIWAHAMSKPLNDKLQNRKLNVNIHKHVAFIIFPNAIEFKST